ncbi:MAG: hypothetical protein KAR79_01945 [Simkaniaceae bacterium]|nr:hypothetical protein [Simkaniaceae bacterium]
MAALSGPTAIINKPLDHSHQLDNNQLEKLLPALKTLIKEKLSREFLYIDRRLNIKQNPTTNFYHLKLSETHVGDSRVDEIPRILMIFKMNITEKFIHKSENGPEQIIQFQKDKDLNIEVLFKSTESHTLDSIISYIDTNGTPNLPCNKTTADSYCAVS